MKIYDAIDPRATLAGKAISVALAATLAIGMCPRFAFADEAEAEALAAEPAIEEVAERGPITVTVIAAGLRDSSGNVTEKTIMSQTLAVGNGCSFGVKKLEASTGVKVGNSSKANFTFGGYRYTYTGNWIGIGAAEGIDLSAGNLKITNKDGVSTASQLFPEGDITLVFVPEYTVTELPGLDFYAIDNVSTGSASWSNADAEGNRSSFSSLSYTFKNPEIASPTYAPNYRFVQWIDFESGATYNAGDKAKFSAPASGVQTVKVYAQWQPSVTVNYYGIDGELLGSVESFEGVTVDFAAPEVEGAEFAGWFAGETAAESFYAAPGVTVVPVERMVVDLTATYSFPEPEEEEIVEPEAEEEETTELEADEEETVEPDAEEEETVESEAEETVEPEAEEEETIEPEAEETVTEDEPEAEDAEEAEEAIEEEPAAEETDAIEPEPEPAAEESEEEAPAIVPAGTIDNGGNNGGNGNGGSRAESQAPVAEPAAAPEPEAVTEAAVTEAPADEPIADEPAPMAAEAETIADDAAPLAAGKGSWSLFDLTAMVLASVLAAGMIIRAARKDEDDEDGDGTSRRRTAKALSLIPAAASIVLFALTQDLTSQMAIFDSWSVAFAAAAVANTALALAGRDKDDEDAEAQATLAPMGA